MPINSRGLYRMVKPCLMRALHALAVLLKRFVPVLAVVVPVTAVCGPAFTSFELGDGGSRLELRDQAGASRGAPRKADQVGFGHPKIGSGGRYAGWLALSPSCCASYAVPLALVVLDRRGQLHEFRGQQATFGWCFERAGSAVAYKRVLLHGATPELYELRRIQDGALLRSFEVPLEVSTGNAPMPRLPRWASCAAHDAAAAQ